MPSLFADTVEEDVDSLIQKEMDTDNGDKDQRVMQTSGSVKWFDCHRGFGFIVPDKPHTVANGQDILVHWSVLEPLGRRDLPEMAIVSCEYVEAPKGLQATKILEIDETQCTATSQIDSNSSRNSPIHVVDDGADWQFVITQINAISWLIRGLAHPTE